MNMPLPPPVANDDIEEVVGGERFGPLALSPGTARSHVVTYYWLALTSIMLFTFVPGVQAALLTALLGIAEEEQGRVTGLLGVVAELVLIAVIFVAGAESDRRGRRVIATTGYAIIAVGIAITPYAGNTAALVATRAFFTIGAAMITAMITTIVSDYVQDQNRGTANGILGFCNGLGATITFVGLVQLPSLFESRGMESVAALRATYLIVAGLSAATALAMHLGLKPGVEIVTASRPTLRELLRVGIQAGKRPGLSFSYAAAFIARADLALAGAFLILWAQQYGENVLGLSNAEALARGGLLVAVANGVAFMVAPAIGILADRIGRVDAVLLSMGIAGVGYTATILVDNPLSGLGYGVAALIGAGQVSTVISTQVLVAEQAPPDVRGSVIGMFGLCGGIGILVALGVGGVLFDQWRPAGPFVLFGVFAFAVLTYGLIIRDRIPRTEAAPLNL